MKMRKLRPEIYWKEKTGNSGKSGEPEEKDSTEAVSSRVVCTRARKQNKPSTSLPGKTPSSLKSPQPLTFGIRLRNDKP